MRASHQARRAEFAALPTGGKLCTHGFETADRKALAGGFCRGAADGSAYAVIYAADRRGDGAGNDSGRIRARAKPRLQRLDRG